MKQKLQLQGPQLEGTLFPQAPTLFKATKGNFF